MKQLLLLPLLFITVISFGQSLEFKITSRISGDATLILGEKIVVYEEDKTMIIPLDLGYAGKGNIETEIIGMSLNYDEYTINFKYPRGMSSGILTADLRTKMLEFEEPTSMATGYASYSAYRFEFTRTYPLGDKLLISGEYSINNPSFIADAFGFQTNKTIEFKNNSMHFINKKNTPSVMEFRNVRTDESISTGIVVFDGTELGRFELKNNLFKWVFSIDGGAESEVKFNFKMTETEKRKQEEITRGKLEEEKKKEAEKIKRELLFSSIQEEILKKEYVKAMELYSQNNLSIQSLKEKIQLGILKVEYDYKSINDDLIEVLKNCKQKYKLEFKDTDYKISSSLSNGLSIYNIKTNETVNLDSEAFITKVDGFNRYCNFSTLFRVNKEKSITDIILSKDFESKLTHPTYGKLHFFYVKDKKGVEKLLYGYETVGKPSSKKYPSVVEFKSYIFSNDFSGRYGKIMYTESITLENYGGKELWKQKSTSSELFKVKTFM